MAEFLWIRGGRIIDPSRGADETADLVIRDGRLTAEAPPTGCPVLDARGLWVLPGLIDLHCHLRDPGQEWKEDIASGTRAAARGGYTAVATMPNTEPAVDTPALVEYQLARAAAVGGSRVLSVGAITVGRQGRELAPMGQLRAAGAVAVSDDGAGVEQAVVMWRALRYAASFGLPVLEHCEDRSLSRGGAMHRGAVSTRLGLPGIPAEAEEVAVARDLVLAEATGAHLHVAHVSTARAVELIRRAKARGVRVTCEVTPHHLTLTDEAVARSRYDPDTKVNPRLRTEEDVAALRAALADGTIDAVATDHAPHGPEEKRCEYEAAAFGISGLETALGVLLTTLVQPGLLAPAALVERLTCGPARVLGHPGGTLAAGAAADVVLVDPRASWRVEPEAFASRGRNTPFKGWNLTGRVVATLVAGKAVWQLG